MGQVSVFTSPKANVDILLSRYHDVVHQLTDLHRERASTLRAEAQTKSQSFAAIMQERSAGVTEAIRAADAEAMEFTLEVIGLRGDILSLQEERDYLVVVLQLRQGRGNADNTGTVNNSGA